MRKDGNASQNRCSVIDSSSTLLGAIPVQEGGTLAQYGRGSDCARQGRSVSVSPAPTCRQLAALSGFAQCAWQARARRFDNGET